MTRKKYSSEDASLDTLLNLDGEIFPMDNGYWTKFEAYRVPSTPQIPHGIKYSLTLHDRNNTRVLGFDNAHTFKPKKNKYRACKITWDHKHKMEKVHPYEFESASRNYSLSPLTANSLFQVSKHNPLGIRILVQSARG